MPDAATRIPAGTLRRLRVVMLLANDGRSDARVDKEAASLAAAGHEVVVLCLAATDLPACEPRAGYRLERCGEWHRGAGPVPPVSLAMTEAGPRRRRASLLGDIKHRLAPWLEHELHALTFVGPARRLQPDVVHAHDFAVLPAAQRVARLTGARLVYDMHELEEGRLPVPGAALRLWKHLIEGWCTRRAAARITVSPSIARHHARQHGVPEPLVLLNAPRGILGSEARQDVRSRCGLADGVPLAVYVGGATPGRGIAKLLEAAARVDGLHLAFLGRVHPALSTLLAGATRDARLAGRLHLLEPVPHDDVVATLRSADLGLCTIPGSCLNYEYCLPNKLFELTLAGLPLVVSRTTELERFVAETGNGLAVDAGDPAAIARGITAVLARRAELRPSPARLGELAALYGWQRQEQQLWALYDRLAESLASPASGEAGHRPASGVLAAPQAGS